MRACCISLVKPTRKVWKNPRRERKPAAEPAKTGQRDTSIVSYFPTIKGGLRMERLRHYAHRSMAVLLETDPEVVFWTTEGEPLSLEDEGEFQPNFFVRERQRNLTLRIVRKELLPESRKAERHRFVKERYGEKGVIFQVFTEELLQADARVQVAEEILWHRPWDVPPAVVFEVGLMASDPPGTLGLLHSRLGGAEETWPLVVALIAQGLIEVGLPDRLDGSTEVRACRTKGFA